MTNNKVKSDYFEWLCSFVCGDKYTHGLSYDKLIHCLHDTEFTYAISMDANRAEDGIELRYRFGSENAYDELTIKHDLDEVPCSLFEMLVALSIRCEVHIMGDSDIGDRTGKWFWDMLDNLNLASMSDEYFNDRFVGIVIDRLLMRKYGAHGEGGLFRVNNRQNDLRDVDIWYQMCWYLNENL